MKGINQSNKNPQHCEKWEMLACFWYVSYFSRTKKGKKIRQHRSQTKRRKIKKYSSCMQGDDSLYSQPVKKKKSICCHFFIDSLGERDNRANLYKSGWFCFFLEQEGDREEETIWTCPSVSWVHWRYQTPQVDYRLH
jgi:hypothetical protein